MAALIGFNPTATIADGDLGSSGKGFSLLDVTTDHQGRQFLFVHASGAITAAGYVVVIDEAGEAALLTLANAGVGDRLGVALGAFADNDYGWVQIYGVCAAIQVSASCAANTLLNSTATSGQVDDATGATLDAIAGMWLTTARGGTAGTAPGILSYPYLSAAI